MAGPRPSLSLPPRTWLFLRAGSVVVLLCLCLPSLAGLTVRGGSVPQVEAEDEHGSSLLLGLQEDGSGPDAKLPELPCFQLRSHSDTSSAPSASESDLWGKTGSTAPASSRLVAGGVAEEQQEEEPCKGQHSSSPQPSSGPRCADPG